MLTITISLWKTHSQMDGIISFKCVVLQLAIIIAFLSILFQNAKSVTIIKEDSLLLFDMEYRFRLS